MSQRRKGPGRPPTSSTIPSRSPAPPPRARAVLLPLPLKTRDLPSLRGAPSEPVFEFYLSVLPARVQPCGVDRAGAAAKAGSLAARMLSLPRPIPSGVCAVVACSVCF